MDENGRPRAQARRATGRGTAASSAVAKAELQGSPMVEGTKYNAGYVVKLETSRRNVDGESPASTRMMQTAEKVEVNLNQKKTEACGSLEMWRNSRRRKKAPAAWSADSSTGHMKILTVGKDKAPAA